MESLLPCSVLKPCRHCGRMAQLREITDRSIVYFTCSFEKPRYVIRCKCGIQTKEYRSKSGAIKCWNREVTRQDT